MENNNPFYQLDQYELRHLVEHLQNARRDQEAHQLLWLESAQIGENPVLAKDIKKWLRKVFSKPALKQETFHNAWYQVQERNGEIGNFVKDTKICRSLAETESENTINRNLQAPTIGLEIRYALIGTSLNNLAGSVPPSLLKRLLETETLTIRQALTYAEQIPNLLNKILSLAVIGSAIEDPRRKELFSHSLSLLATIRDDIEKSEAIIRLAKQVPNPSILAQLIEPARAIQYPKSRVEALLGIFPFLDQSFQTEILKEVLSGIQENEKPQDRATMLVNAAGFLAEPHKEEVLRSVLKTIAEAEHEFWKAETIEKFIEVAPASLLPFAESIIASFKNEQYKATGELAIASRLAVNGNLDVLFRKLKEYKDIQFEKQCASALIKIAPSIASSQVDSVIRLIIRTFGEHYRADILINFAERLPENSLLRLINIVRKVKDTDSKARLFAFLAAQSAKLSNDQFLAEAITLIRQTGLSETTRENAFKVLSPYLSGELLEEAFSSTQTIEDLKQQIITITALIHYLPSEVKFNLLRQELNRAQSLSNDEERSEALMELCVGLAKIGHSADALEIAFAINSLEWRAKAVAEVFSYVQDNQKSKVYQQIIHHWKRLDDQSATGQLIANLAPYLPPTFEYEAITMVQNIEGDSNKLAALTSITEFASLELLHRQIIPELSRVQKDSHGTFRVRQLGYAVAKRLAYLGEHEDAFELACLVKDEFSPSVAFETIIPNLPQKFLSRVLQEVSTFSYEGAQYAVYKELAARFAQLGEDEIAGEFVKEIKFPLQRALACASVVPHAGESLREKAIEHALIVVETMQENIGESQGWWQSEVLTNLASYFSFEDLRRAWLFSIKIENGADRQKALSTLIKGVLECEIKQQHWFWIRSLRLLSLRSRKDLLFDLKALAPLIYTLGTEIAVSDTIEAIHSADKWWGN